jgi:multiple sugar transport system ATP-binding protein
MSDTTKLELESVTKRYGDLVAVDDASLTVRDGELVGLLGPSGSGKSTMLQMIVGLAEPTAGDVYLDGQRVTNQSPAERDIGLVFQDLAIFEKMTVRENLGYAPQIEGQSATAVERTVDSIAEMVGLSPVELDREADQLTPNQQQRVALGRAIAAEPSLMLMDEPMDNLDEEQSFNMRAEIKRLQHELGQTMIYVTHDQEESMSLASRIIVLHEGRIQQIGTPSELYYEPANRFVAGFIGSPSMNFFDATVENGELQFAGVAVPLDQVGSREGVVATNGVGNPTVGIRPEALTLERAQSAVRIDATLVEREPLGAETTCHAETGSVTFTFQTRKRPGFERGDPIEIGVAAEDLYLFDAETGAVIEA